MTVGAPLLRRLVVPVLALGVLSACAVLPVGWTGRQAGLASWYGPGFYGNALGCGGRLSPGTIGVAHKSLPCGTLVTLRHRRRTIRVRVIDRGPYAAGRTYDLTEATKDRLHFPSTGLVWSSR